MRISDWSSDVCSSDLGLGVGLCWPNLLTRVFKSAPKGQENMASAAITTLQLYAMAMGAALAGMVTNAAGFTQPGGLQGAQQAAAALFFVFACAPGLAMAARNRLALLARRDRFHALQIGRASCRERVCTYV